MNTNRSIYCRTESEAFFENQKNLGFQGEGRETDGWRRFFVIPQVSNATQEIYVKKLYHLERQCSLYITNIQCVGVYEEDCIRLGSMTCLCVAVAAFFVVYIQWRGALLLRRRKKSFLDQS